MMRKMGSNRLVCSLMCSRYVFKIPCVRSRTRQIRAPGHLLVEAVGDRRGVRRDTSGASAPHDSKPSVFELRELRPDAGTLLLTTSYYLLPLTCN